MTDRYCDGGASARGSSPSVSKPSANDFTGLIKRSGRLGLKRTQSRVESQVWGLANSPSDFFVQALRRHDPSWNLRVDAHHQKPLPFKVAILSRGDAAARRDTTPQNSRFVRVFEALAAAGTEAEPAIYDEAFADEVRNQLLTADGILVWVDPIHQSKTRAALDPLLREIAKRGPWVSAHPDVILKMGVKEVLYQMRHLGWGADTHRYDSAACFRGEFPPRLRAADPRVLKQNRGNGGQGVWKVEACRIRTPQCAYCRRSAVADPRTCRSTTSQSTDRITHCNHGGRRRRHPQPRDLVRHPHDFPRSRADTRFSVCVRCAEVHEC